MQVVDPWNWLEADGSLPEENPRIWPRVLRVAGVIRSGWDLLLGTGRPTLLLCRRRACRGILWVARTLEDQLLAYCPRCEREEMLIRNWQSTPWAGPQPPGVPLAAWVGPHQHWDRWQHRALAAGVTPELAALGREVMRQSTRQSWKRDLQLECGWEDEGEAMLELARQDSRKAEERWRRLLSTGAFEGGCESPTGRENSAC